MGDVKKSSNLTVMVVMIKYAYAYAYLQFVWGIHNAATSQHSDLTESLIVRLQGYLIIDLLLITVSRYICYSYLGIAAYRIR